MGDKDKIVDEHFWITATTLGLNAYLISEKQNLGNSLCTVFFSTIISLYAIFLILHRSEAHADKIKLPPDLQIPESEKTYKHKLRETCCHFRMLPSQFLFVVCEFSGAFFYMLLVFFSCIGVWLK